MNIDRLTKSLPNSNGCEDANLNARYIPNDVSETDPQHFALHPKPTVLVVEDDEAVSALICRALKRAGYTVDAAPDGPEALKVFSPEVHQLIVSDIMMPHMNGWELAAMIRRYAADVPVILVTGYSTGNGIWNQNFLRQQGILGVINKPIDFDYFLNVIHDALTANRFRSYR